MNPGHAQTYNLLADILVKNKDFSSSKKCLEDGLSKKKTKRGLRYYSIVLRQTGKESIDDRFQKSIEVAKEAVNLDLKDGMSWCIIKRCPWKFVSHVLFSL
jgi:hypothetical protein